MDNNFEDLFEKREKKEVIIDEINDQKDIDIKDLLKAIKEKDISFYNSLGEDDISREKKLLSGIYPLLRWLSCVGINNVDWNEAKRLGRKKGDNKGPWPSKMIDTKNTTRNLLNTNIINQYFWELTKKSNSNKEKIDELLLMVFPSANEMELNILREKYSTKEKVKELIQYLGLNNVEDGEYIRRK